MKHRQLLRETRIVFTNGLLFKNPVLVGALGLFPVAAACFTRQNALQLSLLFFFMALPTGLVLCFLGPYLGQWARPGVSLAVAAVFYLPAMWLTNLIFPGASAGLGVFAYLMIGNSMLLSRVNDYAPTHIAWAIAADVAGCSLGYSVVMLTVAWVRELLLRANWSTTPGVGAVQGEGPFALPFAGFVLLGFLAAFVQWLNNRRAARGAKRSVTRS